PRLIWVSRSMEAAGHRWGFLAPWCVILKGRISFKWPRREEEVWDVKKRRLEVELPTRQDAQDGSRDFFYLSEKDFLKALQKFREALALLAAVAHVDQTAWRYLLQFHCSVDLGEEGEEGREENIPARFYLIIEERNKRKIHKFECLETVEKDLVHFCGVHQRLHPSREYLRDLEKIAALDPKLKPGKPTADIAIPVRLMLPRAVMTKCVKVLVDVHKADKKIRSEWENYDPSKEKQELGTKSLRCTFVLQPMAADFGEDEATSEMIQTMRALTTDGMSFSLAASWLLLENKLRGTERAKRKAFGELMGSFFNGTPRSREPLIPSYDLPMKDQPLQLGAVHLLCVSVLHPRDFEAMFSAIVATQTTTKLSIRMQIMPVEAPVYGHWWKWLAYGVFSKRARLNSSVESLALASIGSMTVEDIDIFNAVLASDHPEEHIYRTSRGEIDERDATLKAGARIRWELDDRGQPQQGSRAVILDLPVTSVRTFSDDGKSQWLDAVVPGYGRCQVQRKDLIFSQSRAVNASPNGLQELKIAFDKDEMPESDGLPRFLAAVGGSLKHLTLEGPMEELDPDTISQTCPNLETLSVLGYFVDIRLDFSQYHEHNQPLPPLKCNWNSVTELEVDLSDPSNPIARSARRLRVRLFPDWWGNWTQTPADYRPSVVDADVSELLGMLEANKTLEYVEIVFPVRYAQYMTDIRKHHLTPVNRGLHLATEAKIAFLSVLSSLVVSHDTSKKRKSQAQQVHLPMPDQHVLAKIFAFAAPNVLRQVFVRKTRDRDFDRERIQVVI
ncbi:hypothetical protein L914_17791, partial [Phytophthora nicotianae]